MDENNNDVKEIEEVASPTQEEEESNEEETSEEDSKEENKTDVDYEKELEMARKQLQKKDKRIGQAEHVIEKLKKEGTPVNDKNIEEMVNSLVEEKVSTAFNQIRGDVRESLISQYSSSDSEAELIRFHLENSIRSTGDDVKDILNAKALANQARYMQQSSEIKRAQGRPQAEKGTSGGQKDSSSPVRLSAQDKKIMQQFGLSPDDLKKGVR